MFKHNYFFHLVDPTQPSEPDVILVNSFDWFSVDADNLELTWDPTLLASVNATAELMDVSLFGYREADDAESVLIVCSFNQNVFLLTRRFTYKRFN